MYNKSEFNQLIGLRLSNAMNAMNLNQRQVLAMCMEKGYEISQSMLSKTLSGSSCQMLPVVQICDVLGLELSETLSLNPEQKISLKRAESQTSSQIITDVRDVAFRGYKGDYHAYFYTTQNEDYIHHGIFSLKEDLKTHQCIVDFRFKTGENNADGNEIEKHYTGTASYSSSMRTIYCDIRSEDIGEISYLLFHYDFLAYQNLECRLATVITVSSGVKRLPTMLKLLLTRKELSEEELEYLCGQLKLNNSEILLSENAYRGFLQDLKLPDSFFNYFGSKETGAEGFISSIAKVTYYSFNESLISDSFLPALDKMKVICLLRKYSSAQRCNKISGKAEEIIYKFLKLQKKQETDSTSLPKLK